MTRKLSNSSDERQGTIVAFGGNALSPNPSEDRLGEQFQKAREAVEALFSLLSDASEPVYIVHGNGPQVGQELLRQEEASRQLPAMSLDACVASTQGWMGYILESTIRNKFRTENIQRGVATLLSQVEVDPQDAAFHDPKKPVGPFYTPYRARQLTREKGWVLREDAGRGYRMVVPSPKPLKIHGVEAARALSDQGFVVIVGGGGGVPVMLTPFGEWRGVEAVIDKDRTSMLMGEAVAAARLILVTAVPEAKIHFGTPQEASLREVTLSEMISYQTEGHFPPGSMGPKVEAAIGFIENGGTEAIITSPSCIGEALIGKSGTRILRDTKSS